MTRSCQKRAWYPKVRVARKGQEKLLSGILKQRFQSRQSSCKHDKHQATRSPGRQCQVQTLDLQFNNVQHLTLKPARVDAHQTWSSSPRARTPRAFRQVSKLAPLGVSFQVSPPKGQVVPHDVPSKRAASMLQALSNSNFPLQWCRSEALIIDLLSASKLRSACCADFLNASAPAVSAFALHVHHVNVITCPFGTYLCNNALLRQILHNMLHSTCLHITIHSAYYTLHVSNTVMMTVNTAQDLSLVHLIDVVGNSRNWFDRRFPVASAHASLEDKTFASESQQQDLAKAQTSAWLAIDTSTIHQNAKNTSDASCCQLLGLTLLPSYPKTPENFLIFRRPVVISLTFASLGTSSWEETWKRPSIPQVLWVSAASDCVQHSP